jgi:hypothetical protein
MDNGALVRFSGLFFHPVKGTNSFAADQGLETAQEFWALLLPVGLQGGALAHIPSKNDGDDDMGQEEGWTDEYLQWWFDFLNERGNKGVSKDTWVMVGQIFAACPNCFFSDNDFL